MHVAINKGSRNYGLLKMPKNGKKYLDIGKKLDSVIYQILDHAVLYISKNLMVGPWNQQKMHFLKR